MKKDMLNKVLAGVVIMAPMVGFSVGNDLYTGADAAGNGIPLETQLRIDIDKDTDVVKIDRDDTTEDKVTKAFVLRHADPYELRPYIRKMVEASEYSGNEGRVECVKYDDGTGVLIVTAEVKKFTKGINDGLSIAELIDKLDQPNVTSSSGQKKFVYFAKHEPADDLAEMLDNVYLQSKKGSTEALEAELAHVKEEVAVDNELNALLVYCNPYNVEKTKAAIAAIDKQGSNNHFKLTVYEVEKHNTAELGHDFQAWKNNHHNLLNFQENSQTIISGGYDSKYMDFLETRGVAKVFTQTEMVLANGKKGNLTVADSTFRDISTYTNGTSTEIPATTAVADGTNVANAVDEGSNAVAEAPDRKVTKDNIVSLDVALEPVKVGSMTMLNLNISNTSFMGFEKNGTMKTHTLQFDTEIVLDTKNAGEYVIGGLEKKELIEVVNKVPVLGSIPLLGYLFSSEDTQTKSTEIVVVIESAKVKSNWGLTAETTEAKFLIEEETEKAGENIEFGTDQYLLDNDKSITDDLQTTADEITEDVLEFIDMF